jgi:hypothetical protein
MRANSSVASLVVVVVLALASGCTPAEDPSVVVPPPEPCTDDVTFAMRVVGSRLEVFPPGHANGFIVLTLASSDDGVHYTAPDADFRAKGDLATLRIARQIYVDCVSSPAAAVWQGLPRPGVFTR